MLLMTRLKHIGKQFLECYFSHLIAFCTHTKNKHPVPAIIMDDDSENEEQSVNIVSSAEIDGDFNADVPGAPTDPRLNPDEFKVGKHKRKPCVKYWRSCLD